MRIIALYDIKWLQLGEMYCYSAKNVFVLEEFLYANYYFLFNLFFVNICRQRHKLNLYQLMATIENKPAVTQLYTHHT